jgi:small subunit ribosomal protein S4e
MGSKVEKHLSRLAMPKTWKLKRKKIKWVTRPLPGAHPFDLGMPINILLRDIIKYARTTREVKNILYNQEILVDGKRRKNHKQIVGLMDVVSIPKIKKNFRLTLNKKGNLVADEIKSEEAKLKSCKVTNKTMIKKGKMQLNLHDAKNILTDNKKINVGDTVVIEIPSQKIKEVLKLEKGATVYLTGGKHMGEEGIVEDIKGTKLVYKRDKETHETLKKYAFVINKK